MKHKGIDYKTSAVQYYLNNNESMDKVCKIFNCEMKNKYKDFDITRQHLGRVVRANNRTRKRTRLQHFPKERYKKPTNKEK
jgi:hypothetical protein